MLEFGRGGDLYSGATYIPANMVLVQCLSWILIAELNWRFIPTARKWGLTIYPGCTYETGNS